MFICSLDLLKKTVNRTRNLAEDSSDEEEVEKPAKKKVITEREEHIGKIICVESTETKKKLPKENWFPALVVAPNAQDTVRIRIKEEYLVRSFKDGRYYTVPKKEATEFTREQAAKQDTPAVQTALEYMNNDRLPTHWDREALFGLGNSSSDYNNEFESDSSDDEPTEEKDHFVAQLYKYMDDRGTPLNKGPSIVNKDVDLYRLYRAVQKLGGYNRVTTQNQWKPIANRLGFSPTTISIQNLVKQAYKKFLLPFEEFDRKLGCTMVAHPRANRIKGRSLLRANSVASPKPEKEVKATTSATEESENTSESSVENSRSKSKASVSGKVKTLVDKFEDKIDEVKKEVKDKEPKALKDSDASTTSTSRAKSVSANANANANANINTNANANTNASASTSVSVSASASTSASASFKEKNHFEPSENKVAKPIEASTPSSRQRDKAPRKPVTPQTEDKKSKKRAKDIEPPAVPVSDKEKDKGGDNDFPINVGDKLKVYYHEQKVTYEAKVIEISTQRDNTLYLVHYAGWNSRYDEWVQKERIAENLTSNKTNKKAKNNGKTETKPGGSMLERPSGPLGPASKASSKRSRGSSRGDSQPPRSTTPSSVASNSSRTKSPATPAQRRTTRGQPALRRTSNNTDISSLQTDSESDSDEPVVKKPAPRRKTSNNSRTNQTSRGSNLPSSNDSKNNSNPSSEEETLANIKSREFNLNDCHSALKGLKDLKSSSPEADNERREEQEQKFDINTVKKEPDVAAKTESTPDNKTSSENSSETDSYVDEDSQFSDKRTTLENFSEKFQKFVFRRASTSAAGKSEVVQRVATLKPSSIEKIIKTSLAEKSKALPEKLSMKTLCERSPVKLEKEKEKEREREREREREEKEKAISAEKQKEQEHKETESAEVKSIIASSSLAPDAAALATSVSTTSSSIASSSLTSLTQIDPSHSVIKSEPQEPKSTPKLSYLDKPILQKSNLLKSGQKEKVGAKHLLKDVQQAADDDMRAQASTSAASTCDVYEFKEPEPFEFETAKKQSPETEKKGKRKANIDKTDPSKVAAAKRAKKNMKEIEKIKDIKLEDDEPTSTSPIPSPIPILVPPKVESIFDSLRKSPSFNLNLLGPNALDEPSTSAEIKPLDAAPITVPLPAPRPLFINSFVEAKPIEDTSTVFDLKSKERDVREEMEKGLESVKKILLTDEELNFEPPKVDKPSSIADKVLKALSSQNTLRLEKEKLEAAEASTSKTAIEPIQSTSDADKPKDVKAKEKDTHVATPSAASIPNVPSTSAQTVVQLAPAIINKEIETPPIKPVLSSPEHRIDILESIAPKNNDLSETIQKLESAIQKSAESALISDDSTDSTDSEQRLVIEDESQSSETQNECSLRQTKKEEVPQQVIVKVETVHISTYSAEAKTNVVLDDVYKLNTDLDALKAAECALNTLAAAADPIKCEQDDALADNAQNESISMLLCEETIPGSPAPVCPKEICDNKKNYDSIFASPHPTGGDKPTSTETVSSDAKAKNETATPSSSPRDSMSQDDSSEENQKKQGTFPCSHILK